MTGIETRGARTKVAAGAFVMLFSFAGNTLAAGGSSWWVGTWQLSEDKRTPGFTDDYMDFSASGTVTLRDSKSTFANCAYDPSESVIVLKCILKGKERAFSFRVSTDKRSLTNSLGDVYRKLR